MPPLLFSPERVMRKHFHEEIRMRHLDVPHHSSRVDYFHHRCETNRSYPT